MHLVGDIDGARLLSSLWVVLPKKVRVTRVMYRSRRLYVYGLLWTDDGGGGVLAAGQRVSRERAIRWRGVGRVVEGGV